MGMFTAYALSTDKLNALEFIYRNIKISKTRELLWQVCVKNLLSDMINSFLSIEDRLRVPVYFPVTFIPFFSVKYFGLCGRYIPSWKKYMNAGTNFPFLRIRPDILNRRLAIDGGAIDNIPLYPLLKSVDEDNKPDLIFVLHFDSRYDYRKEFVTDIPIVELDLGICNNFSKDHFNFDEQYVDDMLKLSYQYGKKICDILFDGELNKESLQQKADEIFVSEHQQRQQHRSADGLVSVLNIVGKALRDDLQCMVKLYNENDLDKQDSDEQK